MADDRSEALALLGKIVSNTGLIVAEQKKTREALDRMANSNFGLGRDLRKWFKSASVQPTLNFDGAQLAAETIIPSCTYEGCDWKGLARDWYQHALDVHKRELPDFMRKREEGWDE